ncbi:MAG TPA: hypothetical protein VIV12_26420 [Streptosporangiaceae bacterium]
MKLGERHIVAGKPRDRDWLLVVAVIGSGDVDEATTILLAGCRSGQHGQDHSHRKPLLRWLQTEAPWRDEWETFSVPRRTWLDHKVDALLEELAASSMHLDRQRAGELITDRVRAVAALMRVTEPTARKYLDDETIRDMARRMLFEFAGEQPGADLLKVPRTVSLPLVLVGIVVAALAEAMQVRAANEPPDRLGDVVATYGQTLSGLGQITAEAASIQAGSSAEGMFPPALLRRAARYISNAADLAASGGKLPDGVPETARDMLAAALRRDADRLIAVTTT